MFTLVVPLVASACADGGDDADAADIAQQRAAILADVEANGTELEKRLLDDGRVSKAELEEAALAVVACAEDQGVNVDIEDDGDGYAMTVATDQLGVFDECSFRFYDDVSVVWAIQNRTPPDLQEQIDSAVVECLANQGFDVPDWPDVGSAELDASVESQCFDQVLADLQGAAE